MCGGQLVVSASGEGGTLLNCVGWWYMVGRDSPTSIFICNSIDLQSEYELLETVTLPFISY